jgi:hypothetical protein
MSDGYPWDYTTREIQHAYVHTVINYAEKQSELREYEVHTNDELATLLMEMRNPQHGEWIVDVDVTFRD